MKAYKNRNIIQLNGQTKLQVKLNLINEEPLSIRIQGEPYTLVMRTPGDEIAHVAGFCLGEGIVDSPDDFNSIGYCDEDINVVTITLNSKRLISIPDILKRRGFISQTSCGVCGKELIDDLRQNIAAVPEEALIVDINAARNCLNALSDYQVLRSKTRASHAAALFKYDGQFLSVSEDVGRHNALDKSIGKLFLDKRLDEASLLVLSSRISYELVQKAARAKIPVIFAVSRPTALAVELAEKLDMALVCLNKNNGLFVFCGSHRLSMNKGSGKK